MPTDPIYVDKTLFLGRVEEQKQFRAALAEVLAAPPGEDLPYVLHLFGDGGVSARPGTGWSRAMSRALLIPASCGAAYSKQRAAGRIG